MMICLGIDTVFAQLEYLCITIEEYIQGKRETLRLKIILFYTFMGGIYCFGNGFDLVIFTD